MERKDDHDELDLLFNGSMMFGGMGWAEYIRKTGEGIWAVWYEPFDAEHADMYEESEHDISSLISYVLERDIWMEGEDVEVAPSIALTESEQEYFSHTHEEGLIGPHLNGLLKHLQKRGYEKELFLVKIAAGMKWIDPLDRVDSDMIGLHVKAVTLKAVWKGQYRKAFAVSSYYGKGLMYPPDEAGNTSFFLDNDQAAHSFDYKPRRLRLSERAIEEMNRVQREHFRISLIFHIPHSRVDIPVSMRVQFLLSDEELRVEQLKVTDRYADELFDPTGYPRVICPVSRLVCDVERFVDDEEEVMAAYGAGVIYERCSNGRKLRRALQPAERENLIRTYHRRNESDIEGYLREAVRSNGMALIIDCHTFPSIPLGYDLHQSVPRPEICIGTDSVQTPESLISLVHEYFIGNGYSVALNDPYAGTYIPRLHSYQAKKTDLARSSAMKVQSIMIEVNRSLYMDEATGEKHDGFIRVQEDLRQLWPFLKNHIAGTGEGS